MFVPPSTTVDHGGSGRFLAELEAVEERSGRGA
jgi:hypothetical protein